MFPVIVYIRRMTLVLFHFVLLELLHGVVVVAKLCTKIKAIQGEAKKVSAIRRVPSTCSNWDKSWAWLTKIDCGTKYKFDYITVPPRDVTYKLEYACCEGDTSCKIDPGLTPSSLDSSGLDSSDDKFLAIVLGSTAAALFILIIVITISVLQWRRQLSCPVICDDRSHIYETAEDLDEATQLQGSPEQDVCVEENGNKVCESEYEEIGDGRLQKKELDDLPRYTDLFKEKEKLAQELGIDPHQGDPFKGATAPPLKHEGLVGAELHGDQRSVQEVLQGTAKILQKEASETQQSGDLCKDQGDKTYYNCSTEKGAEAVPISDKDHLAASCHKGSESSCLETRSEMEGANKQPADDTETEPKTPASSTYDKLGNSVSDKDTSHEYECLVDLEEPSLDAVSDDSVHIVNSPSQSQPQKSMNGHIGATNVDC